MKYPKTFAVVATVVGATALSAPLAAADRVDKSGFYVGGGLGQSSVEFDQAGANFDDEDTAWKIFGGYRASVSPMLDLAVEGGYRDFGNPEQTVGGLNAEYEASGVDLYGVGIVPVGVVDIFGKVGGIWYDQELTVNGVKAEDNDEVDLAYGLGVGTDFGNVGVRAEWERFDLNGVGDTDMYSISASWRF